MEPVTGLYSTRTYIIYKTEASRMLRTQVGFRMKRTSDVYSSADKLQAMMASLILANSNQFKCTNTSQILVTNTSTFIG